MAPSATHGCPESSSDGHVDLSTAFACSIQISGALETSHKDCSPDPLLEALESQCAICLDGIALADVAVVKGCEHTYCVHCIVQWAGMRRAEARQADATCPTCKAPFSLLHVHRQLDGTLTDYQVEESAALLARAPWFVSWAEAEERRREMYAYPAFRSPAGAAGALARGAHAARYDSDDVGEEWYDDDDDAYGDDEDLEDAYHAGRRGGAGASTGRVTIGNRRWGANGYVSSGHRSATPAAKAHAGAKTGSRSSHTPGGASKGTAKQPAHVSKPAAADGKQPRPGCQVQGKRASRKAKHAEARQGV